MRVCSRKHTKSVMGRKETNDGFRYRPVADQARRRMGCSPRTFRIFRSTSASNRGVGATTGNWPVPMFGSMARFTSIGTLPFIVRGGEEAPGSAFDRDYSST
jgi:hypothetical protein